MKNKNYHSDNQISKLISNEIIFKIIILATTHFHEHIEMYIKVMALIWKGLVSK